MHESRKYLAIIITLSFLAMTILMLSTSELWWDEATYIAMGKYLYSSGNSGFIEYMRPVVLPFILGFFWKLGLDPIISGKMLAIIASLMLIVMTYTTTEKLNKNAPTYSALILALTGYFMFFGTKTLTDIPSTLLVFIALNRILKKEINEKDITIAAISGTLAVMLRFTSISLIFPVFVGIILKSRTKDERDEIQKISLKKTISNIRTYIKVTILTITPYFLYSEIAYGSPLFSIRNAIINITQVNAYYSGSITDVILQMFNQNQLLIFFIPGIYILIRKAYKEKDDNSAIILLEILISCISVYTIPVKIVRYTLIALPGICIASGIGLSGTIDEITKRTNITRYLNNAIKTIIIIITLIIILNNTINPYIQEYNTRTANSPTEKIYAQIIELSREGSIMTTNPIIAGYTDQKIEAFGGPLYAKAAYEQNIDETSLILINTCDLLCPDDDTACASGIEHLLKRIDTENRVITVENEDECTWLLYENPNYQTPNESGQARPLWWDEAVYMRLAENLNTEGKYEFNMNDQEKFRAPLYPTLLASIFLFTPISETTPIYLNIILAMMTAILAYMLTKEISGDKRAAIVSSILLVTSTQYILWASKILTETIAITLTTAALYLTVTITKKEDEHPNTNNTTKTTEKERYQIMRLAAVLALAFLTRYPLALLTVYTLTYIAITTPKAFTKDKKTTAISILIYVLILTPWLIHSYNTYGSPVGAALFNLSDINRTDESSSATYYLTTLAESMPALAILLILGTLITITPINNTIAKKTASKSSQSRHELFLIGWIAITIIGFTVLVSQKQLRFILITLPAIATISSLAITKIAEKLSKKDAGTIIILATLIISTTSAGNGYHMITDNIQAGQIIIEASDYISSNSAEDSAIMSENYVMFHYYTNRPVTWYPKDTWNIEEFIKKYNVRYIVVDNFIYHPEYTSYWFDKNPGFNKVFDKTESQYFVRIYDTKTAD